jgi:TRAP-type mannitol/chloroaromatic compound transport system permease small subunit
MGTLLSIVAIIASFVIIILPTSSLAVSYAAGVIVVAFIGAAILRSRAGWFAAAALLSWFSVMVVHPFSLSTREFNGLRRFARRGDEEAQKLLDYYAVLEPYSMYMMLGLAVLIVAAFAFGTRRVPEGAHRYMLDASNSLQKFIVHVGNTAALLYIPMMLIIVYDVLQRKYLGLNPEFTNTEWYKIFTSTKLQEMQWHLHGALFLLCLAYGYVKDSHVRIELASDLMSARTRAWIELGGTVMFLVPYCYIIMQYGTESTLRSFDIGESSAAQTGLEYRYIIKSLIPIGFTLMALAGMAITLRCVVFLFGPASLREDARVHKASSHNMPARAEA